MKAGLPAMVRGHAGNAGWSVVEQGANPAVQLLLTPLLLADAGKSGFAVWAAGIALLAMSQLVSMGAGFATIKHVSADLGAGRTADAVAAIRAALGASVAGGCVAAALAVLLAPAVAVHAFHQIASPAALTPVLMLCGAGVLINEIDNVFACALRGAQRFDLAGGSESSCRLVMAGSIAMLASSGWSIVSMFGAWIGMMTLKALIKAMVVRHCFGGFLAYLPSWNREPLRRLLRFGGWQWLQSAATVFFTSADQLLVGALLGAGALTRYSVCLQLAQYVHLLPSVMLQVMFPRISARGESLDAARANQILAASTRLAAGAALLIGLPMALLSRPLLAAWVGPGFALDNGLLLLILVLVHVVLALNIGGYYMLLGTGRAARSAALVLGAGAAQVAAMVLAAPFGLMAVACSRFTYSLLTLSLYGAARRRT